MAAELILQEWRIKRRRKKNIGIITEMFTPYEEFEVALIFIGNRDTFSVPTDKILDKIAKELSKITIKK